MSNPHSPKRELRLSSQPGPSPLEARRQHRANQLRWRRIDSHVAEIDDAALVDVHRVLRAAQVGRAKISGVVELADHAAAAWTGLAVKVDLHSQMAPNAVPGLGLIMQRALIEVDEALDDCSHAVTGRGQA